MTVKNAIQLGITLMLATTAFVFAGESAQTTAKTEPVAIKTQAPEVPYDIARLGIEGEVIVLMRVDENGRVQTVQVEKATHPVYADSVVNAVRSWRFEPAKVDGQAVSRQVRLPVVFN